MIHTEDTIWIAAPPERVFDLAADIAQWPTLLPHYRWVRVLEENGNQRLVEMSARRSHIPVKWTSVQRLVPEQGRVLYTHVGGITRGMEVEWRLAPEDGGTRVVISHWLKPRRWFLRNPLAAWIVGQFFVKSIAGRTLHYIKRHAEGNPINRDQEPLVG